MDVRGKGEWWRNTRLFLRRNQRLLWLLGLFLAGVQIGCLVFRADVALYGNTLSVLLTPTAPKSGFAGMCNLMTSACAPVFCLLATLFLAGLSACGLPLALAVPLFYGTGIGLAEAYYFAHGGWGVGYTALFILPHTLLSLVSLLIACAESLRMSLCLARQLLPRGGSCGSLWSDFKLYLARFLLCVALLFGAGVLDTLLRMCFLAQFV